MVFYEFLLFNKECNFTLKRKQHPLSSKLFFCFFMACSFFCGSVFAMHQQDEKTEETDMVPSMGVDADKGESKNIIERPPETDHRLISEDDKKEYSASLVRSDGVVEEGAGTLRKSKRKTPIVRTATLEKVERERDLLQAQLTGIDEAERKRIDDQLQKLQTEHEQLIKNTETMRRENEGVQRLQEDYDQVIKERDRLLQEKEKLQTEALDAKSKTTIAEGRLTTVDREKTAADKKLDDLHKQLEKARHEEGQMKGRSGVLGEEVKSYAEKNDKLHDKIGELNKLIASLEVELKYKKELIEGMEVKREDGYELLAGRLTDIQTEIAGLSLTGRENKGLNDGVEKTNLLSGFMPFDETERELVIEGGDDIRASERYVFKNMSLNLDSEHPLKIEWVDDGAMKMACPSLDEGQECRVKIWQQLIMVPDGWGDKKCVAKANMECKGCSTLKYRLTYGGEQSSKMVKGQRDYKVELPLSSDEISDDKVVVVKWSAKLKSADDSVTIKAPTVVIDGVGETTLPEEKGLSPELVGVFEGDDEIKDVQIRKITEKAPVWDDFKIIRGCTRTEIDKEVAGFVIGECVLSGEAGEGAEQYYNVTVTINNQEKVLLLYCPSATDEML